MLWPMLCRTLRRYPPVSSRHWPFLQGCGKHSCSFIEHSKPEPNYILKVGHLFQYTTTDTILISKDMLPALENFVNYGSETLTQNRPYLEAIVDMVRTIFKDDKVG